MNDRYETKHEGMHIYIRDAFEGKILTDDMILDLLNEYERFRIDQVGDVLHERARQDQKWGEQNHDPIKWSAIMAEEVGEFAEQALKLDDCSITEYKSIHDRLRAEAVQVCAVALATVECLDRDLWERRGSK